MNKVSVIIPCLNEEHFIIRCLDSVLKNNIREELEIFVVDGMSKDRTREIVKEYEQRHNSIYLLDNPRRSAAAALNVGIKKSTGDIIIRLDAHAVYSENYFAKSIECLKKYKAANVGGIIKTIPRRDTLIAQAIALSMSHIFGVGRSFFRIGSKKTRSVDTVPFGCFRRDIFDKIGYFNESRPRNEDIDFNARIRRVGEKIILSPEIVSYYYPRGTLKDFWKHSFDNGYKTASHVDFYNSFLSLRHFVPFFSVFALIALIIVSFFNSIILFILLALLSFYVALSIYFSFRIALKEGNIKYFFVMPFIFALLHFGYGLGSICGSTKLWKNNKYTKDR